MNKIFIISGFLLVSLFFLLGCTDVENMPFTVCQLIARTYESDGVTPATCARAFAGDYNSLILGIGGPDGNSPQWFDAGDLNVSVGDINWSDITGLPIGCPAGFAIQILDADLTCIAVGGSYGDTNVADYLSDTYGDLNSDLNYLQSGDNVSELNNDSGFITSYSDTNFETAGYDFGTIAPDFNLGEHSFYVGPDEQGYDSLANAWAFNTAYIGELIINVLAPYGIDPLGSLYAHFGWFDANVYANDSLVVANVVEATTFIGDGSNLTGISTLDTNWDNTWSVFDANLQNYFALNTNVYSWIDGNKTIDTNIPDTNIWTKGLLDDSNVWQGDFNVTENLKADGNYLCDAITCYKISDLNNDTGFYGTRVYMSTGQTIANNTNTLIQFNTEDYDIGNSFNTGTYTYTIPENGYYNIYAQLVMIELDDAKRALIKIRADEGGGYNDISVGYEVSSFANAYPIINTQITRHFVSGDTIQVWVNQANGGNLTVGSSNSAYSHIEIMKVNGVKGDKGVAGDVNGAGTQILEHNTTPTNPDSGFVKIYAKNDDQIYTLNNDGNELQLATTNNSAVTAYLSSDQSLAQSVTEVIAFDTESFDVLKEFDTAVNTGRFTALNSGKYLIITNVHFCDTDDVGTYAVWIRKNGSDLLAKQQLGLNSTSHPNDTRYPFAFSIITSMETGDYIEIMAYATPASAGNRVIWGLNETTSVSIMKVG